MDSLFFLSFLVSCQNNFCFSKQIYFCLNKNILGLIASIEKTIYYKRQIQSLQGGFCKIKKNCKTLLYIWEIQFQVTFAFVFWRKNILKCSHRNFFGRSEAEGQTSRELDSKRNKWIKKKVPQQRHDHQFCTPPISLVKFEGKIQDCFTSYKNFLDD